MENCTTTQRSTCCPQQSYHIVVSTWVQTVTNRTEAISCPSTWREPIIVEVQAKKEETLPWIYPGNEVVINEKANNGEINKRGKGTVREMFLHHLSRWLVLKQSCLNCEIISWLRNDGRRVRWQTSIIYVCERGWCASPIRPVVLSRQR